jgi:hypothetical protein
MGLPLGNESPGRRVSIAGVVFTPARGVIHPSFPLRGRWERSAKSDKQAPSPSLVSLYISSFETRLRYRYCTACAITFLLRYPRKVFIILKLAFVQFQPRAPNPASRFELERFKN